MASLTLVLSSARSGSTLLCRDIASLGGLGFPREYLRGMARQARSGALSEADVLERLAPGVQDGAPGATAVKLMVDQAGPAYAAVTGRRPDSPAAALSGFVTWARAHYDQVLLVFLVRNAVDQAISRVVASETGVFHTTAPGGPGCDGTAAVAPAVDDLNPRILAELARVVRDRRALDQVRAEHADLALLLTYDELTEQVGATTSRLVAHARAQGLEVQHPAVTRRLEKVISAERSTALRASFLDYLRTESGA